ncbi:hypothetical protein [Corynebacterium urinipleomorphum]|uniref:hypothetical protein n=1 Tax=Corynebacterium urinipleomorphum TaxID=1852380 RepID=UPI00117848F4|nr:hypothetical protein [Corynebacterium urinipleomorphum]
MYGHLSPGLTTALSLPERITPTVKKLSTVTAALLAAAAITAAPAADAATTSSSYSSRTHESAVSTDLDAANEADETPTISFYRSAMGNMFKCGGSFGKLWCKK